MKAKSIFTSCLTTGTLGIAVLGLLALAGCDEPEPRPYPRPVVVEPGPVIVENDLIYYPDYEVYYDPFARVYWHAERGVWVSGPAPVGVSVEVLRGAPFVHTGFHESPELHHAEIVRRYPHGWRPDGRR